MAKKSDAKPAAPSRLKSSALVDMPLTDFNLKEHEAFFTRHQSWEGNRLRNLQLSFQKAAVDAFDKQATTWFAKMRQNGLESRTLAALRDALLPKLLSGELRVPVAAQHLGTNA